MKIKQILNNNAVLVKKGTNELIVLANGIGFKRKIGPNLSTRKKSIKYLFWIRMKWSSILATCLARYHPNIYT